MILIHPRGIPPFIRLSERLTQLTRHKFIDPLDGLHNKYSSNAKEIPFSSIGKPLEMRRANWMPTQKISLLWHFPTIRIAIIDPMIGVIMSNFDQGFSSLNDLDATMDSDTEHRVQPTSWSFNSFSSPQLPKKAEALPTDEWIAYLFQLNEGETNPDGAGSEETGRFQSVRRTQC